MSGAWEQAQKLLAELPRDPGTGGDHTLQTLMRTNNQLLAILIVRLAALGSQPGVDDWKPQP